MQNWFKWKGVDSRTMGVIVPNAPAIYHPALRVQNMTIPGRSGTLTLTEGDNVYESYTHSINIGFADSADVRRIAAWLHGEGDLILSSEPDRASVARINQQISFERMMQHYQSATIPFYCQPLKKAVPVEADITLNASGGSVNNIGDVPARPVITVRMSSSCTVSDTSSLTIGGQAVAISGMSANESIVLDWDMMDAHGTDGVTNMNARVSGSAQELPVGASFVTWTGKIASVKITPNWRYV